MTNQNSQLNAQGVERAHFSGEGRMEQVPKMATTLTEDGRTLAMLIENMDVDLPADSSAMVIAQKSVAIVVPVADGIHDAEVQIDFRGFVFSTNPLFRAQLIVYLCGKTHTVEFSGGEIEENYFHTFTGTIRPGSDLRMVITILADRISRSQKGILKLNVESIELLFREYRFQDDPLEPDE